MVHNCSHWTRLGINCPAPLITAFTKLSLELEPGEPEELDQVLAEKQPALKEREEEVEIALPGHRRAKQPPPDNMQNVQRMLLLELYRRAVSGVPVVKVPEEIVREAYTAGARGKELALWVAAGAASLAIGLRFGPSAVQGIPNLLLRGITGAPGSAGGGGLHFNASKRMQALLHGGSLRRLATGALSAAVDTGGSFGFDSDP